MHSEVIEVCCSRDIDSEDAVFWEIVWYYLVPAWNIQDILKSHVEGKCLCLYPSPSCSFERFTSGVNMMLICNILFSSKNINKKILLVYYF